MHRCVPFLLAILISGIPSVLRADGPLAHMVFFKLKDNSQDARIRLIRACEEFLAGHDGTLHFSVGVRAEDMTRDVNDRDFDVALHVVFRDHAAHSQYQTHQRHLKFIEENADSWSNVRVFDSYLSSVQTAVTGAASEAARPKRLPLPDAASSFAGMVQGTVRRVGNDEIVLQIEQVVRQWEHSKAQDADALVGKRVVVNGLQNDFVVPFLRSLKPGDKVRLDVAHREGEKLTLLELTEDQRERVRPSTD